MRFKRIELVELARDVDPGAEREPAEPDADAAPERSSQVKMVQAEGSFVDEGADADVAPDAQAQAADRRASGAREAAAQYRNESPAEQRKEGGPGPHLRSATACVALCPACKIDGQRIALNLTPYLDPDAPATWRYAACPWCGWEGTVNLTRAASGALSADGEAAAGVVREMLDASPNQWPSA